jgi:vitamin B12/bleomycin/antimicrobial peptide transport system ATP-binding/permease protein
MDDPFLTGTCFCIKRGDTVLLTGPSGSGKTTLVRAIAGISQFSQGRIKPSDGVLFVPQWPYLPIDTLRDAIAYSGATPAAHR